MSNCPQCNNPINQEQVICLKCGIQVKPLKKQKSSNKNWVIITIVLVVIQFVVMFLVLFLPGLIG